MGHQIHYMTCEENVNRTKVLNDIQDRARRDGDGYSSYVRWHDNVSPCDSYEDAKKFIDDRDRGDYDDHAVRYYDYSQLPETAKEKKFKDQIQELRIAKAEWIRSHSVKTQKAQYIGCPTCGSKLNKDRLRGESCPLCNTDLRSRYILEKIEWYDHKINLCYDAIAEERKKQKKKARVMWLVKYEFHE